MQILGTITYINPAGGYDGTAGHVYTFDMTIQTPDGQMYSGQIGSKAQVYPMAVGSQINVTVTTDQYGTKFKKFNPKYPPQQAPQQQAPPPQQTQAPPVMNPAPLPQQAPQPTFAQLDKNERDDERQLLIVRQSSLNRAVEIFLGTGGDKPETPSAAMTTAIKMLAEDFKNYIYNGLPYEKPADVPGPDDEIPY